MKSFVKILFERLKSETPVFFKKIVTIGVTIGGIGTSILLAAAITPLPDSITKLAGYAVTAGVVAAAIAKSTTKDSELSQKSEELLTKKKETE